MFYAPCALLHPWQGGQPALSTCLLPWLAGRGECSCSLSPTKAPSTGTPGLACCSSNITSLPAASTRLGGCSAWLCGVALRALHHSSSLRSKSFFHSYKFSYLMFLLKLSSFWFRPWSSTVMFESNWQFFILIKIEEMTSQTLWGAPFKYSAHICVSAPAAGPIWAVKIRFGLCRCFHGQLKYRIETKYSYV